MDYAIINAEELTEFEKKCDSLSEMGYIPRFNMVINSKPATSILIYHQQWQKENKPVIKENAPMRFIDKLKFLFA